MWNEEDHPRDKDGRFTDGASSARFGSIIPGKGIPHKGELPETIKLPDEQLPRSVGAKWRNLKISLPNGEYACFVEGSKLQDKEIFAGAGCRRKIDEIDSLVAQYGGDPTKWVKVKAVGEIQLPNGEIQKAQIHWYEEPSIGKVKVKRKKICE